MIICDNNTDCSYTGDKKEDHRHQKPTLRSLSNNTKSVKTPSPKHRLRKTLLERAESLSPLLLRRSLKKKHRYSETQGSTPNLDYKYTHHATADKLNSNCEVKCLHKEPPPPEKPKTAGSRASNFLQRLLSPVRNVNFGRAFSLRSGFLSGSTNQQRGRSTQHQSHTNNQPDLPKELEVSQVDGNRNRCAQPRSPTDLVPRSPCTETQAIPKSQSKTSLKSDSAPSYQSATKSSSLKNKPAVSKPKRTISSSSIKNGLKSPRNEFASQVRTPASEGTGEVFAFDSSDADMEKVQGAFYISF